MGCNCGKISAPQHRAKTNVPSITNGTNQLLLKQMAEQQRQQLAIQQVIQHSNNRTLIKTYR